MIEYVKKFLEENKITDIELSTNCVDGAAACYNFSTNVMGINEDVIYKNAKNNNLMVEDMVEIIISHELGHYLDNELPELHCKKNAILDEARNNITNCDFEKVINEASSLIMKAENNAWTLGERYIKSHLLEKYNELKDETLRIQGNAAKNEIHHLLSLMIKAEMLKSGL